MGFLFLLIYIHSFIFFIKKENIYSKPYNTVQQLYTLFQSVVSKQTLDMIRQLTIKDKIKQKFRFCFIDTYHT